MRNVESRNGNGNGRVGRVDVCVNRYFQQVQGFIDGGCSDWYSGQRCASDIAVDFPWL